MIYIDENVKIPLYEQIYNSIKHSVYAGELKKGSRLRAVRSLAKELDVSNNTIVKAYQMLLDDGLVKSVPGSGYYVKKILIKGTSQKQTPFCNKSEEQIQYDFDSEPIDSKIFPWSKWRHYLMKAISDEEIKNCIKYEDKKGSIALRMALCNYVFQSRGIKCEPDQIVICAGKQYALDILFDILPDSYQKVALEDPCLKRVREAFLFKKKELQAIPVNESGIDVGYLEKTDCNLLYTSPSHNFPLGYTTSLTKRVQMTEWARRNHAYIIEDDFEGEFYDGRMIPAIQSLDKNSRVIYLHTLSRVLSPSVRCTFMILPVQLIQAYEKRYSNYYTAIPIHNQNALAEFINDGHILTQIRKTANYNNCKYQKIKKIFEDKGNEHITVLEVSSKTHILLQLDDDIDSTKLKEYLLENGMNCNTADDLYLDSKCSKNMLILGFHGIEEECLEEACERLNELIEHFI